MLFRLHFKSFVLLRKKNVEKNEKYSTCFLINFLDFSVRRIILLILKECVIKAQKCSRLCQQRLSVYDDEKSFDPLQNL
jgi:hypothetical protein